MLLLCYAVLCFADLRYAVLCLASQIDKYFLQIFADADLFDRLSKEEQDYCDRYEPMGAKLSITW